jgi:signal transduction histidine kinase
MANSFPLCSSEPHTVLLIEDNDADARLVREMLRESPCRRFRLECADRLSTGLERLADGGVDVVLLDLSLPESQGLDSFLRIHERFPDVPVVVLTGSKDEEMGNKAVQSGAQDYLIKGQVDSPVLGRALRYALERGRIEKELRRRAEQLAEMDRRKDEFLATLAHELRNPLAPIGNSLHILRLSGGGPPAERVLEMMERQVAHLVRLVDDLMEISRITRGKIDLRKDCVALSSVLNSAVETSRPLIESARHQLIVSLPDEPVMLQADPIRLCQVVANLLNNAAKYTEEGGQIRLTARREGSEAVVSVRDSGLGIPIDMLPRIFDMFAQVDRTLKRSQGGLGIGLTLARTLMEMHGGRIEAHSGGLGQGSEFILRIPLAQDDISTTVDQQTQNGRKHAQLHQQRVLVVDDNRDAADSLCLLLKFLGAAACVVYDGPSALKALRLYRPSMVFLDIGMPGMDGYEVARHMRQSTEQNGVKLIAMTGWGQEEDRRRSEAAGFDRHLVKPVNAEALQALLDSLAEKRNFRVESH